MAMWPGNLRAAMQVNDYAMAILKDRKVHLFQADVEHRNLPRWRFKAAKPPF